MGVKHPDDEPDGNNNEQTPAVTGEEDAPGNYKKDSHYASHMDKDKKTESSVDLLPGPRAYANNANTCQYLPCGKSC